MENDHFEYEIDANDVIRKVSELQTPIRFPFRCDSPELRRFMIMEISPLPDGAVNFSTWIDEESKRDRIRLLDPGEPRDLDRLLRMCAWCKKLDVMGGVWLELEEALSRFAVFDQDPLPQITHGVCTPCQRLVVGETVDGSDSVDLGEAGGEEKT